MTENPPAATLSPDLSRALHIINHQHAVRAGIFVVLAIASSQGACWAAHAIVPQTLRWTVLLSLDLLTAVSLHGISLFTHEAVHGTLCRNRQWNALLGAICAVPVLQNFTAYRVLHLRHHEHLGEDGDPDHYPNYTRWSWLVFLMNWGRLLIGYPAYILAIPVLGFKHGTAADRIGIVVEVSLSGLFVLGLLRLPMPLFLHGWLIPMLIINSLVNVRGMSQHTLLEQHHSDPIRGTRSILTNPVTTFFMCNENYHLEHHLYPGVPWYHLPRVHQALRQELIERGAPYIPSYFAFVRAFVVGSFRRSPLGDARINRKGP